MYLKSRSSFVCLFKVLRGSFSSLHFGDKTALGPQSYRFARKINASSSGEIFKENFTDIFYTNLEQIAFSLYAKTALPTHKQNKNWLANRPLQAERHCATGEKACFGTPFTNNFLSSKTCKSTALGRNILHQRWCALSSFYASFSPEVIQRQTHPPFRCKKVKYSKGFARDAHTAKCMPLVARNGHNFRLCKYSICKPYKPSCFCASSQRQTHAPFKCKKVKPEGFAYSTTLLQTMGLYAKPLGLSEAQQRQKTSKKVMASLAPPIVHQKKGNHAHKKRSYKLKNTPISLNIKIGDYLSSGDKIGEKKVNERISKKMEPVISFLHKNRLLVQPAMRMLSSYVTPYKPSVCKHGPTNQRYCTLGKSVTEGVKIYKPIARSEAATIDNARRANSKQPSRAALGGARHAQPLCTCSRLRSSKVHVKAESTARTKSACCTNRKLGPLLASPKAKHRQGAQSASLYKPSVCTAYKPKVCSQAIPIILTSSGRIVVLSKTQLIVQKTQPVLFYDSANLHVKKGELVSQGAPILTLTHQTLITGDIVQGIPRIEQLFEAFTSPQKGVKDRKRINVHDTLHSQVRDIFRKNWLKNVLSIAVRKSLEEIQSILLEMIQKVYLSQGVLISDKHIEIIIRQMTSKGQILDSGSTGLLLEEVLPLRQIENANITTPGKKCLYVPSVVGLTAASLTCDSFISAASFQETTRVLSRDAVVGKSDFLRGLKEKVVIGDLISAGTGLEIYFIYTLFSQSI